MLWPLIFLLDFAPFIENLLHSRILKLELSFFPERHVLHVFGTNETNACVVPSIAYGQYKREDAAKEKRATIFL